jgi:hypothetical protein
MANNYPNKSFEDIARAAGKDRNAAGGVASKLKASGKKAAPGNSGRAGAIDRRISKGSSKSKNDNDADDRTNQESGY